MEEGMYAGCGSISRTLPSPILWDIIRKWKLSAQTPWRGSVWGPSIMLGSCWAGNPIIMPDPGLSIQDMAANQPHFRPSMHYNWCLSAFKCLTAVTDCGARIVVSGAGSACGVLYLTKEVQGSNNSNWISPVMRLLASVDLAEDC